MCSKGKGVFSLLLKDIAGLVTSVASKRDVCEVWNRVSWGKQGELVFSGFHMLFQILSSEKFLCRYSLGACSTGGFFSTPHPVLCTLCFVPAIPPASWHVHMSWAEHRWAGGCVRAWMCQQPKCCSPARSGP